MSLTEVNKMIQQHDQTGDSALSYKEFKAVFFDGKELEDTEGI